MRPQVVILAGGRGTRLLPYTITIPKPLMPIGEIPILELVLKQLVASGFGEATLAVNHQAELIRAFFGDGSRWGVRIRYSFESRPLGTMGPLRLLSELPENFLVMNGDVLTDLDFMQFFEWHCRGKAALSICATEREQPIDFGVLTAGSDGDLLGFQEKPVHRYLVSMGVYGVNRRILEWLPPDEPFGFDQLVLRLLEAKQRVPLHRHQGYWLDIGRPDDLARATRDFVNEQIRFLR